MAWNAGQKLQGGKYVVEKILGQGGFGITYLVKKSQENRVIKTLNASFQYRSDFAKFQQDFLNEALRLAKFSHPHIVRVDEVIQEGELWCMVMEYIDGNNLAQQTWTQGSLSEAEALRYIRQVGEALTIVHDNGLLHRDIKPLNIMVRKTEAEAVLIDFGIAREFTPNITQTQTQFLSEGFAPIEQYDWRAKRGAYTDIYALAATLYSLITGEIPTPAPVRAFGINLETPKEINDQVSDRLNQAIIKGMAMKPEQRPQSVSEWLSLLPPVMDNLSIDNYSKLKQLLAAKKWQAADAETGKLMLKVAKREGWLRVEDIAQFPAQDLQIIDQLWTDSSQGRFGISVQKRIWQNIVGNQKPNWETWCSFGDRVGWRQNGNWLSYSSLDFSLQAPEGQLPALVVADNFTLRHQESIAALLSRK